MDQSTFSYSYYFIIRQKEAFVLEMSDYARAAPSDIGENEKWSSPKMLSLNIVFAWPAERYQKRDIAPAAKCG